MPSGHTLLPRVLVLFAFIGAMWLVLGLDALRPPGHSVVGFGVVPRTYDGLSGILVAPIIHRDLDHLIANTIPLLVLGALVLLRGVEEFVFALVVIAVVSGVGTWLFGSGGSQHVGASGIVLGFIGFLLFRSAFDRRLSSFIVTVCVAALYASVVLLSLIPQGGFSWSLHFWGFVGGIVAARLRYPRGRHVLAQYGRMS
jgi:membrane associated rhomboid family serine protease